MKDISINKATNEVIGMIKDIDPQLLKDGQYTHAINSQLNSNLGQFSFIQNEPGNKLCLTLPANLKFIGSIPLEDDRFVVFSTDNTNSEIGIFKGLTCEYTTLVNDPCLSFKTTHPIRGVYKNNTDCTTSIYWQDDLNPNRFLNIDSIPYKYTFDTDACRTKLFTDDLDCEQLLVDQLINVPCIEIKKSTAGGTLRNGSYQLAMAYSIAGEKVTNIYSVTNPQPIFTHENVGGAIEGTFSNLDTDFDEFKLYVIVTIAQQTTVFEVGNYSTKSSTIVVSSISDKMPQIPLSEVYLQKVVYNRSKDVISVANRLLWVGATTKAELNYQTLANQIRAKWVAYSVPIDYYEQGGNKVAYMRDENYLFGIQWLYNTGDWSPVFPIINRAPSAADTNPVVSQDAYELFVEQCDKVDTVPAWKVYNTAAGNVPNITAGNCDEIVLSTGEFGYAESTELYPDNVELYGELACTPIRLFKFPDDCIAPRQVDPNKKTMVILGAEFDNIQHPVDYDGNRLTNISGYRIVRSSRVGQETITGKGILFNMGKYNIPRVGDALYPNYPFNDLRTDPFLSKTMVKGGTTEKNYSPLGEYMNDYFTFHSPDLSFEKPSLGTELKIEGTISGASSTKFEEVYGHPKHKLVTDVAFICAALLGIGEAYFATRKPEIVDITVKSLNPGNAVGGVGNPAITAAFNVYKTTVDGIRSGKLLSGTTEEAAIKIAKQTFLTAVQAALNIPGAGGEFEYSEHSVSTAVDSIPKAIRLLNDIYLFSFYFQQGTKVALDAIKEFSKFEQYALQANSYCYFTDFQCVTKGHARRYLNSAAYLYPAMQEFEGYKVNNFKRESSVIVKINNPVNRPSVKDDSRKTLTTANACGSKEYTATASCLYGSIKVTRPSQYGQIDSVQWLDTGYCERIVTPLRKYKTGVVFGGDTFLNRFTFKRHLHYFNQTEFKELDGHEFDYRKYVNIAYPRYWVNTEDFDLTEFINLTSPELPNDRSNLDCKKKVTSALKSPFIVRNKFFYTSNNSVVDFLVESKHNIAHRDWEDQSFLRHYDKDRYSDLTTLLRSDNLEFDNRYIYDKSLSKELLENYAATQRVTFDKNKAETCYTSYSGRVYWSLPFIKGQLKDSWGSYLPNDYYDFSSTNGNLVSAKALTKTNILFLFDQTGPHLHQAQDVLTLDSGLKVTIGDSGLFGNAPVPLVNTDVKYGACSSKWATISTQFGAFFPSAEQGRVFQTMGTELKDIAMDGMSWWFKANMPLILTKDFPTYPHKDNPMEGIGYLSAFDSTDSVYYLIKRDFKVKWEFKSSITYNETTNKFIYKNPRTNVELPVKLTDTTYFDSACWTASYNLRTQSWVSFHDWHPVAVLQEERRFLTVTNKIGTSSTGWRHNVRCDIFSYFYNQQHPWEVEYVVNNGGNTAVLHSVEYSLECYLYDDNCVDVNHLLDYNFNEAIISNTEQISGLLKMRIASKNQITKVLSTPVINADSISISYKKEEQKYRFNQFWDVTNDRGEFSNSTTTPFITSPDGYHFVPNPAYINYNKPLFERKKMRHNWHKVYLRRTHTDDAQPKMILKFQNNKQTLSPR